VNATDELLARVLDAATGVKRCEDQLKPKKKNPRSSQTSSKVREVYGGIFETLLQTVKNLSLKL